MGKGWEATFQVQLKHLSFKSREADNTKVSKGKERGWLGTIFDATCNGNHHKVMLV